MDHFRIQLETIEDNGGLYFNLRFHGIDDRVFEFKAKSKDDSLNWQIELKRHIDNSDGVKHNRTAAGLK